MSGEQANGAAPEGKNKVTNEDVDELSKTLSKTEIADTKTEEDNEDKAQEQLYKSPITTVKDERRTDKNAQKKLEFDSPGPSTSPQDGKEKEDDSLNDGKWLPNHPWEDKTPDRQNSKMDDTIGKSEVYTVTNKWKTPNKVDLKTIYSDLPVFISEMKGPTCRQGLDDIISKLYEMQLASSLKNPHVQEIVDEKKGNIPKDKPSPKGESLKASSLEQQTYHEPLKEYYRYLDCEYMLKMYLPKHSLKWFTFSHEKERCIRAINPNKKNSRWVFIPSFRRAEIALLEWPPDDIVTHEPTIRILVVRPSEFEKYVECCGHKFPVISLPQDEIGAGYPRLWIQKIALRLKLDFIWMIDDSVECFYEYHPKKKPPKGSYKDYRRRRFGTVFKRIENLVKNAQDGEQPIAAMSPKHFRGGTQVNSPFVCSPPRAAVFLNIKALKLKDVYYRPELQAFEDMIFGYECEQNGLKVFIDNRIHFQDHKWKDTGARCRYVQQKQPESAPDPPPNNDGDDDDDDGDDDDNGDGHSDDDDDDDGDRNDDGDDDADK